MARIDVPTMQCDRCKVTNQELDEMGKYRNIRGQYDKYQGANESWDLCPECWQDFLMFVAGQLPPITMETEPGIPGATLDRRRP